MHVDDEARPAQRLWSQPMQWPDVESLEHRIHSHPLSSVQAMCETYRLSVDEDEVDLRVRHAERFDDVLDRWRAIKCVSEAAFAPVSYTHLRAHETRHDL